MLQMLAELPAQHCRWAFHRASQSSGLPAAAARALSASTFPQKLGPSTCTVRCLSPASNVQVLYLAASPSHWVAHPEIRNSAPKTADVITSFNFSSYREG